MTQPVIQTSFASGEISPSLYGRVDLAKYHTGAKLLRNFFVDYRGGVSNRAGTRYVGRCYNDALPVRLIPFTFSTVQTYVLEFGQFYMRVIKNAGYVLAPDTTIYRLTTPWAAADLALLKFTQNADTLTLTHPNYPPYDITRTAHNAWTVTQVGFGSTVVPPTGLSASGTTAASPGWNYSYVVTAVDSNGVESVASTRLDITLVVNMSTTAASIQVNWNPITNVSYYNVYRTIASVNAVPAGATFGFVGSTVGISFADTNIIPDFSKTPPTRQNPFAPSAIATIGATANGTGIPDNATVTVTDSTGTGAVILPIIRSGQLISAVVISGGQNYTAPTFTLSGGSGYSFGYTLGPSTGIYPGVVGYFQQRKVYAATLNAPDKFWMSQPGRYKNFDITNPVRDDNSISGVLASLQVNNIKSMISMPTGLIMLTGGGAWQVTGGGATAAITPKTATAQPQAYSGISDLTPIVINYNMLYVQALGSIVRDLSYNFYANVYTGVDMTVLSSHFFRNNTIISWSYAEEPYKVVWCVRDDGTLLSLTYLKEQDVYGWCLHTTDGLFKDCVTISENGENMTYFIVQRTVNGTTVQNVERMESRRFSDLNGVWFVDCGLSYSGAASKVLAGLDHLEGKSVAILGDGNVFPRQTVVAGKVTLDQAVSKAVVGLPYQAQGQTLSLEEAGGAGTMQTKRKLVPAATLRVERSRGLKVGSSFNTLVQFKERDQQQYGTPIQLITGDERITMDPMWGTEATVCFQQDDPLPCTVLAVIPEVAIGDTAK